MNTNRFRDEEQSLHQGLDHLSRQYVQLQDDEPPALVDLAVRNLARREAGQNRPLFTHFKTLRWIGGLATASVALITLGLVLVQPGPEQPGLPGSFESRSSEESTTRSAPSSAGRRATPSSASPAVENSAFDAEEVFEPKQQSDAVDVRQRAAPGVPVELTDSLEEAMPSAAPEQDQAAKPVREALPVTSPPPGNETTGALLKTETPEAWLQRIRTLQQQEDWQEAKAELEKFRQHYPDYPLPPEILSTEQ